MKIRKIQNYNGTSAVTIPIDYCRSIGIKKGSYVYLVLKDNKIVLAPILEDRQTTAKTGAGTPLQEVCK